MFIETFPKSCGSVVLFVGLSHLIRRDAKNFRVYRLTKPYELRSNIRLFVILHAVHLQIEATCWQTRRMWLLGRMRRL